MGIALNKSDLRHLTDTADRERQMKQLEAWGIPYKVRLNGSLMVFSRDVEAWKNGLIAPPVQYERLVADGPYTYIYGNCVYFMEAGEFVKIGYTGDIRRRRIYAPREYGVPGPWPVLGAYQAQYKEYAERVLHTRFEDDRAERELFRRSPDLLEFIETKAYLEID